MTCTVIPMAIRSREQIQLRETSPGFSEEQCFGSHLESQWVRTEEGYDPMILPDMKDSGSYLQNAPHPGDMLYGRIYSTFDNQSDYRGGGTPSKLYYVASQQLLTVSMIYLTIGMS